MSRLTKVAVVLLATVAGAIALALIALACALLLVDADSYRPAVQRQLSDALGREISIDHLAVGKSLYPTIEVTGLRVANPPWASRPDLASADSAFVKLDLIALIRGEIEVGRVEVRGLDLLLERDATGAGNWQLPARDRQGSGESTARIPNFDDVTVRDAVIGWRSADGRETNVRIETADAVLRADKPLRIEVEVVYRQVPVAATLATNTTLADVLARRPLVASLALRSSDARGNLEIALPNLFELGDLSVNFAANGQRLDALSALVDRPLPTWGPYRVSGRATLASGRVRLDNLKMSVDGLGGQTPLAVSRVQIDSGEVSVGRDVPTVVRLAGILDDTGFRLDVTTADFAQLVAGTGQLPVAVAAMLGNFELDTEGAIRLPVDALSFELTTHIKGDVGVATRLVGVAPFTKALPVDLAGRIEGDTSQVRASTLRGTVAQTSVAGDLAVRFATPVRVTGALELGRVDLAALDVIADKKKRPTTGRQAQAGPPAWLEAVEADLQLRIERIAGLPVSAAGMSGRLIVEAGQLQVRKFRGTLADTLLSADAGVRWKDKRPHVDASISVPVLDVAALRGKTVAASETQGDGKKGSEKKGGEKKGGAKTLDAPLPLASLRTIDADLKLDVGRLQGLSIPVERLRGSAQLTGGRLQVPSLIAVVAGISMQSTLQADASQDDARLRATASASRFDLARLLKKLELEAPATGTIGQSTVTVETHGASLRNWIGNAKMSARVDPSMLKQRDGEAELRVDRASLLAGPDVNVRAEMRGMFREYPVELAVTGGRLAELLDGKPEWPEMTARVRAVVKEKPLDVVAQSALGPLLSGRDIPVRVEARVAGAHSIAAGTIADLKNPERTPLDVALVVDSLSRLPFAPEDSPLPDIPLSAAARVVFDEKAISLSRLALRAGDSDLAGDISLVYGDRIKLTANLTSKLLDLRPFYARKVQEAPASSSATSSSSAFAASSSTAELDQPFDLKLLRSMDADVRVRSQRVITDRLDLDDVHLQTALQDGRLKKSLAFAEGGSAIELGFDASGEVPAVAVTLTTSDLNLETLKPPDVAPAKAPTPHVTLNAQLAGAGQTPRKVYASANGFAVLSLGPGRVGASRTPFLFQVVSANLMETLLPGRKPDDYNQLECAAARFELKDGIARSPDGIALRFKRMDILGSGAINLSTREILFGFRAVRRRWLDFSILSVASDFAQISGTLDQPRVGLDTSGVLFKGGAAWATLGLSLLATNVLRTLSASEDPCAAIVEKGRTSTDPVDALIRKLPVPGIGPSK